MYCWHAEYALAPGAAGRFQSWLAKRLAPVLRAQSTLQGAVVLRGERSNRLVLATWWPDREAVETFLATPAFQHEREQLAALDLLSTPVTTHTHEPACPLPGRWTTLPPRRSRIRRNTRLSRGRR